jgi:hypothetical protein
MLTVSTGFWSCGSLEDGRPYHAFCPFVEYHRPSRSLGFLGRPYRGVVQQPDDGRRIVWASGPSLMHLCASLGEESRYRF